eukprot:IDg2751t1
MMLHKNVPQEFWADALVTAAYIRNRVTSRGIPTDSTPYSLWMGRAPDVSHVRVFGSKCCTKRLQAVDVNKEETIVSRDVVFNEAPSQDAILPDFSAPDQGGELDEDYSQNYNPRSEKISSTHSESSDDRDDETTATEPIGGSPTLSATLSTPATRKSTRNRQAPGKWWKATALYCAAPESSLSFNAATKGEESKQWLPAIQSEIDSIKKNNTWTLVPRTEARNILTSKWIFKRKDTLNEEGTPFSKYKARIVTRGFQQKEGIDYAETFAPVVRFTTIRIFLALVASLDLHCHQMDVKTAFLNGELDQDVYMEQPQGFHDPKYKDHVCKLQRALYGLKQAPRQWFSKINSFLINDLGFKSSAYDPCLYVRNRKSSTVLISLYVDDLLLACNNLDTLKWFKNAFFEKFDMTDCGEADVCLGFEIRRNRENKTLHLSQTRYTTKILERFGMGDCKLVVTPMNV